MHRSSLKETMVSMSSREPNEELEHYAITILANEEGNPVWSAQTNWVGFQDQDRKVELRKASIVRANHLVRILRDDLKEGCVVVESSEELRIFLLIGGHSVIERNLAEAVFPEFLKPRPVVRTGFTGFECIANFPETIFQRAPTKKQRIQVLKRDNYRCKICGRSPHNNVDVTLHIHHIRPWADKGLTHDDNLITLCHTCHEGLDPHYDVSLYGLLNESGRLVDVDESRQEFFAALRKYREESFKHSYAECD
jgi:hypothetical protein